MESLVKLTVKTPNQGIDDIQINCDLDWTVRKLKEYLQDVYPSNPSSSSQRLIYLGRLLQDHLSLKEVFGEWGARTLHIVCNESTDPASTSNAATTNTTTTSVPATSTTPGADGLRFRGFATADALQRNQSFPGTTAMHAGTTAMHASMFPHYASAANFTAAQSTQFHQMQAQLAQHYQLQMQQHYQQWHQWQQSISGGQWPYNQYLPGMFPTPPNTPLSTSPSPTPNTSLPPQPLPGQQQQQPQQQQQQQPEVPPNQANRNVQMNAGPGGVGMQDEDDNENPRNRDWLDWLYTSLRAFMLLSIVYFYSSTSRFIMVTILAFLLYLYQNGWFTPRRVPIVEPAEEAPVNEPEPERNGAQDDIHGQQHNSEAQDDSDINSTHQLPLPNETARLSPFKLICTFFVSFVTSLIPSPPPAIPQQ